MGKIVVGVDGSANARDALVWAIEEAKVRNFDLHLVHSWTFPPPPPHAPGELAHVDLEAAANAVLDEAAAVVPSGVTLTKEIATESPARALIHASADADLIVVGARGLGGFRGLLLGSASHQVIHHARCPIVVVPGAERAQAGS